MLIKSGHTYRRRQWMEDLLHPTKRAEPRSSWPSPGSGSLSVEPATPPKAERSKHHTMANTTRVRIPDVRDEVTLPGSFTVDEVRDALAGIYPILETADGCATADGSVVTFSRPQGGTKGL